MVLIKGAMAPDFLFVSEALEVLSCKHKLEKALDETSPGGSEGERADRLALEG